MLLQHLSRAENETWKHLALWVKWECLRLSWLSARLSFSSQIHLAKAKPNIVHIKKIKCQHNFLWTWKSAHFLKHPLAFQHFQMSHLDHMKENNPVLESKVQDPACSPARPSYPLCLCNSTFSCSHGCLTLPSLPEFWQKSPTQPPCQPMHFSDCQGLWNQYLTPLVLTARGTRSTPHIHSSYKQAPLGVASLGDGIKEDSRCTQGTAGAKVPCLLATGHRWSTPVSASLALSFLLHTRAFCWRQACASVLPTFLSKWNQLDTAPFQKPFKNPSPELWQATFLNMACWGGCWGKFNWGTVSLCSQCPGNC
jgi:hypothetical protein